MLAAKNHHEFNEALNKLAGTIGKSYSEPWHMSIKSGRNYMQQYHESVGRKVAAALLENSGRGNTILQSDHVRSDPSPQQKAALQALACSKTSEEYGQAFKLAQLNRAISTAAALALRKPAQAKPVALITSPSLHAGQAQLSSSLQMQTSVTSLQPADVTMEENVSSVGHDVVTESLDLNDTAPSAMVDHANAIHLPSETEPMRLSVQTSGKPGEAKVAPRKKIRRKA